MRNQQSLAVRGAKHSPRAKLQVPRNPSIHAWPKVLGFGFRMIRCLVRQPLNGCIGLLANFNISIQSLGRKCVVVQGEKWLASISAFDVDASRLRRTTVFSTDRGADWCSGNWTNATSSISDND